MKRALHALAIAALWLLLGSAEGLAQSSVRVIGAVTPGHCVSFFSTSQIQDSGGTCGGGGGGGITGPGVSTVGDLAVWNNGTGSALADTSLAFPGGFSFAGTLTGATAVTFPTSGTLATTANANVASVTGTAGQITVSPTTGAVVVSLPATITANLTLSGTVNNTGVAQINGVPLGTFATQNFATPPAIGGTTPAAGAFTTLSATGNLTTNITGSTQCLQVNTLGVVSGTGSVCAAGGGAVSSVSGTAGQITVSPTTGAVVVSLPATITASLTLSGTVNHSGPFQIGGTTVALPISLANGGTNNAALTASAGGIVWSDASKLNVLAGTSTAGLCLLSGNLVTPAWTACPGGAPGGANTNVQFNNSSAFGGDAGFTYAGNGQATLALGTITTNLKALNITGTWNAVGTTFDAPLFMNITATAEAAASTLFDFQVGGVPLLILQPKTNAILSLGDGAAATAIRAYNTVDTLANPVNYERGVFSWTSGANILVIGAQAGGTGILRAVSLQGNGFSLADPGTNTTNFIIHSETNSSAFSLQLVGPAGGTGNYLAAIQNTDGSSFLVIGISTGTPYFGFGPGSASRDTFLSRTAPSVFAIGSAIAGTQGFMNWGGEARVTADFSVTSSVALTNVTGLSVSVAAGRTYQFETELYVTDAAAGGVQAAIAGTATATAIQYTGYTIADNAIKGKTNATALATAVGSTVTTETAGIIVRITGTITVNAAGTLTVQMAQNTSNGTATVAKRGSWLIVNDMP